MNQLLSLGIAGVAIALLAIIFLLSPILIYNRLVRLHKDFQRALQLLEYLAASIRDLNRSLQSQDPSNPA